MLGLARIDANKRGFSGFPGPARGYRTSMRKAADALGDLVRLAYSADESANLNEYVTTDKPNSRLRYQTDTTCIMLRSKELLNEQNYNNALGSQVYLEHSMPCLRRTHSG
jgi:hypothetical protein